MQCMQSPQFSHPPMTKAIARLHFAGGRTHGTVDTVNEPLTTPASPGRVAGPEAKRRLIEAAITLLRTTAFDHVSTRKIALAAAVNPSAIPRNFGDLEGLFIEVTNELRRRCVAELGAEPSIDDLFNEDFVLRTRMVAWLLGRGTAPSRFTRTSTAEGGWLFESQRNPKGVSERTARSFQSMMVLLVEGSTIFFETHSFGAQDVIDAFELVQLFRTSLPDYEARLGWAEVDHPTAEGPDDQL